MVRQASHRATTCCLFQQVESELLHKLCHTQSGHCAAYSLPRTHCRKSMVTMPLCALSPLHSTLSTTFSVKRAFCTHCLCIDDAL
ncbi:hypothetical protein EGR_10628 [Echinococcus granulosus]|uniref:Uncharacterized protein n=1 Tax=Echinococcus granulosus TaxID=6210 RepID=W6U0G8_ECHGR|nr:hypothetical protein EGR_10628 [Echinococcus granulosus]EUB54518.1 hypothetical protein EGR_10628 [Echinococcus granulosus]